MAKMVTHFDRKDRFPHRPRPQSPVWLLQELGTTMLFIRVGLLFLFGYFSLCTYPICQLPKGEAWETPWTLTVIFPNMRTWTEMQRLHNASWSTLLAYMSQQLWQEAFGLYSHSSKVQRLQVTWWESKHLVSGTHGTGSRSWSRIQWKEFSFGIKLPSWLGPTSQPLVFWFICGLWWGLGVGHPDFAP
jgi:hypothetical protein